MSEEIIMELDSNSKLLDVKTEDVKVEEDITPKCEPYSRDKVRLEQLEGYKQK